MEKTIPSCLERKTPQKENSECRKHDHQLQYLCSFLVITGLIFHTQYIVHFSKLDTQSEYPLDVGQEKHCITGP